MAKHIIGKVTEIPPGQRKIVDIDGRSIGVFNVDGTFYALRNSCPHQAAPLCKGSVRGMTTAPEPGKYDYVREGEILRCPWHGWEFDVTTGKSIVDPQRLRVRSYDVAVESGGTPPARPAPAVADEPPPAVETYDVRVEDQSVVLYI